MEDLYEAMLFAFQTLSSPLPRLPFKGVFWSFGILGDLLWFPPTMIVMSIMAMMMDTAPPILLVDCSGVS